MYLSPDLAPTLAKDRNNRLLATAYARREARAARRRRRAVRVAHRAVTRISEAGQ